MARTLTKNEITTMLSQTVSDLKPGDVSDLAAVLSRIPGGASGNDKDRSAESTLGVLLAGGYGGQ